MTEPKISVITATYNAAAHLPALIDSLVAQTDQDFEWVVADGASTDGTLALLEAAKQRLKAVIVDSRPDRGIYDALNRAVELASGEYYIVVGSDDTLAPDAILQYRNACRRTGADMVTARIVIGEGDSQGPRWPRWEWLYNFSAHVSGHAVGLAIRRDLHERFGMYSLSYPIAADRLFILRSIHGGAKVVEADFVAGRFENHTGTSGRKVLQALYEGYRVQLAVGHRFWVQTLLFVLRLIRHRRRIEVLNKGDLESIS